MRKFCVKSSWNKKLHGIHKNGKTVFIVATGFYLEKVYLNFEAHLPAGSAPFTGRLSPVSRNRCNPGFLDDSAPYHGKDVTLTSSISASGKAAAQINTSLARPSIIRLLSLRNRPTSKF